MSQTLNAAALLRENEELRLRLQEAEELLSAIRSGEVDALAVQGSEGTRIFTLQGADQAYRALIEGMNEGALLLDEEGTVLYANTCAAALLERELTALMGSCLWEWIPAEYGTYFRELLDGGWGGKSKGELPLRNGSGRLHPFSVSMSALPFHEVPVLGVILTDLSAQREIRTIQARVEAQNRLLERKDAELKLRQAAHAEAQRLNTLLAQAPVAIAIFRGPDYVIELANQMHLALWGRTADQVLGKPFFEALPEARGQGYEALLDQVRISGEPFFANDLSVVLERHSQLERVYFSFVYQPLREADGTVTGVIAVAHDITELKKAQQELEQHKDLLQSVFDVSYNGLSVLKSVRNPAGEIVDMEYVLANQVTKQTNKRADLEGKLYSEVHAGFKGTNYFEVVRGVVETGESHQYQLHYAFEHLDHWFNVTTVKLDDGVVISFEDISEVKKAEMALRQSQAHLQQLFESIPQMTWTNLPSGEINFYNQRWYEYTGLDYEQSKAWGWQGVVHPEDLPATLEASVRALQTGEIFIVENRYRRGSDGSYRWHLNRAVPIRDEKGVITLWVGTATDVHEQKQLAESLQLTSGKLAASNQELRVANQEIQASYQELGQVNGQLTRINQDLDNFVYTASHDLKSPISNIEGLLKALERQLSSDIRQQAVVGQLYQLLYASVDRFKATIRDLTEVARISKESNEDITTIDLSEMLEQVRLDLAPQLSEAQARLDVHLDCPPIRFSRKNLKSILYNLISNAVKYRSPERALLIRIHSQMQGEYYCLTVADNGLGMDMRQEEKIFALFKRLHNHVEGTGIGLYMVKKMIENAGGKIEVESQVDVGSAFKVYFRR